MSTGLRVTVDDVELLPTEFTFVGRIVPFPGWDDAAAIAADPDFIVKNNPIPGFRGGTVTLATPVEHATVRIWSDPAPARTTDYAEGEMKMAQWNLAMEILWVTDRAQHQILQRDPCVTKVRPVVLADGDADALLSS